MSTRGLVVARALLQVVPAGCCWGTAPRTFGRPTSLCRTSHIYNTELKLITAPSVELPGLALLVFQKRLEMKDA